MNEQRINHPVTKDKIIDFPVAGQPEPDLLQPLREIGSDVKTRYWDSDDIFAALREAHRLGINPEMLRQSGAPQPAA